MPVLPRPEGFRSSTTAHLRPGVKLIDHSRSAMPSQSTSPPLPSQQKPAMPAGMSKFASWGARQPDVVERAFEKAMKEKEEGKKKGKRSRGVKLEF